MSRNNILSRSSQHWAVPTTSRSKRRLDGAQRPAAAGPPAAAMALDEDGARQPGSSRPEPGLQVSTRRYALTPVARAAEKRRSAAESLPQERPRPGGGPAAWEGMRRSRLPVLPSGEPDPGRAAAGTPGGFAPANPDPAGPWRLALEFLPGALVPVEHGHLKCLLSVAGVPGRPGPGREAGS